MNVNSLKARLLQKKVLSSCVVAVAAVIGAAVMLGREKEKPVAVVDNVAYNFSNDIDRHGFEWDFSNRVEKQSKDIALLQEKIESKDDASVAITDALDIANVQNKELEQRLESLEEKLYAQATRGNNQIAKNSTSGASFDNAANAVNSDYPGDDVTFDNSRDTLHHA
jgi:hypothetical protein